VVVPHAGCGVREARASRSRRRTACCSACGPPARLDSAWRRSAGLSAAPSGDRAAAPAFATFGAHAPHRPLLYREFLEALVRVLVLRAEVCAEASAAPFDVCTIVADGVAKLSLFANLDVATPTEDDAHLLTMAPTAS